MRIIKKILFWLLILIVLANLLLLITGNAYVYKTLYYQYVDIDDYKIFDNRTVQAGTYIPIPDAVSYNKVKLSAEFRNYLVKTQTTAFLVLKNDSVCYEEYWDGYGPDAISGSFSVAKSIVSILVGIAIDESNIKSVDQKVSDFIPEYKEGLNAQLTIKHLLTMSAAMDWDESYATLFSMTTKAYYGRNLEKIVLNMKVTETPGKKFNYQSGNQLVLAYILRKATATTLSEYASAKLWKPLGAKTDALWSLDHKDGLEKAYCCFNANARDFSRFGTLYLHDGMFNGRQIVSADYVKRSVEPANLMDDEGRPSDCYGYSWWLSSINGEKIFYAQGILGQFIIVIPSRNIVAVRLGKKREPMNDMPASQYISQSIIKDFNIQQ
jgi:CubicO group peptidase (beta-lactamase class C family)